jgi:hypothetical protein
MKYIVYLLTIIKELALKYIKLSLFILVLLFFYSCDPTMNNDDNTIYSQYQPILADRGQLDNITCTQAISVKNPGKIYSYKNFILLNEIDEGFHIIDNSNPSNPVNVGFLKIIASRDVAVKNDILYSDNSTDLIAVNISDLHNPKVISRIKDVYPEPLPPDDLPVNPEYQPKNKPQNTVIVKWRKINEN